jgi:hypothetical protein
MLILMLVVAASAALVSGTTPSDFPKPSVPEFTLSVANHTSDTPTTYSTDPYTGETITHNGVHYEWRTLDVIIKNQPFKSFVATIGDSDWTIRLMYNIRWKGHFSGEWRQIGGDEFPFQNRTSEYTTVSYFLSGQTPDGVPSGWALSLPSNGQVDFQVEALIGFTHRVAIIFSPWYFEGQASDWSNIHTINVTEGIESIILNTSEPPLSSLFPPGYNSTPSQQNSPSAAPTATQTPTATPNQNNTQVSTIPLFDWQNSVIVVMALAIAALVAVIIFQRKKAHENTKLAAHA